MQAFILALFCCATLSDFLIEQFSLPPIARFLPEILSGLLLLYVMVAGTRDRFRLVAPKYWLLFGALALVILCGIINNNPGAGPLITGLRFYFRGAPLFFLAAVLPMSETQLLRQFKVLLALAFIQVPVAVYQRWVIMSAGRYSGDGVQGTLLDSGILSMLLICTVLVLTGLLLKRRIGKLQYLVFFLVLLFPTTINETKVTVIFLPLGLLVTLFVGAEPGKRMRYTGIALALLIVFGAIFVPVYDKMEEGDPNRIDIVDFFTDQQKLSQYVVANDKGKATGVGGKQVAHRGEAISIPLQYLAKDPVRVAFGLGLGNVSPSTMGKNFEGSYYKLFENISVTSFAYFVLEFGVLGVMLIGALFWMVFSDSLSVARRDDTLTGALAAGWTGVVAIFLVATLYNPFHFFTSVTFLYWYLSGIICARATALRRDSAGIAHPPVQLQSTPIAGSTALSTHATKHGPRKSVLSQRVDS
jgi:hypothetical protein